MTDPVSWAVIVTVLAITIAGASWSSALRCWLARMSTSFPNNGFSGRAFVATTSYRMRMLARAFSRLSISPWPACGKFLGCRQSARQRVRW